MSDNVSKNILEKIKEGGIKPRPRWQFVLSRVMLVTALVAAITVGGLVMSLVFLKLNNLDWEFISMVGERGLPPILEVLPLLWILLLIIVLLLTVFTFEKTEGGYKYSPVWVVFGAVILSMSLGEFIYLSSGAERFDEAMRYHLPFYEFMENERETRFNLPEKGILPGRILLIESKSKLELEDLQAKIWEVELMSPLVDRKDVGSLKPGQMVLLIGKPIGENSFQAEDLKLKRKGNIKIMMNIIRKTGNLTGNSLPPPPFPPMVMTLAPSEGQN